MPKPLSHDLRYRIISHIHSGHTQHDTAKHFDVSRSCVASLVSIWKQTGTVEPQKMGRPKGQGKLMPFRDFILDTLSSLPDITMPELSKLLAHECGLSVTASGLSRFLLREGYTYKKNSGRHRTRPGGREGQAQ